MHIWVSSRLALSLAVAIVPLALASAIASDNSSSSSEGISPIQMNLEKTIPQIVSEQLANKRPDCDDLTPLDYEICLAYQGALGVWQVLDKPDVCPNTLSNGTSQATASGSHKASDLSPISPDDALRARNSDCFQTLYSMHVATIVPILISTPLTIFYETNGLPFNKPGSDADVCFEARFGICGNHTAVAIKFFERAGLKARSLQFFYEFEGKRLSHIIPELLISERWRPVDTTYGAVWFTDTPGEPLRLSTTEELLAAPPN